jgi:hypothetical protein
MIDSERVKERVISREHFDKTLERVKIAKYRCLFLLMYDAGLRISEACSLCVGDVDFQKSILKIFTLKKRGDEVIRVIPMTSRLREELALYYQNLQFRKSADYWFPAGKASANLEYYNPKTAWKRFKRYFPLGKPHDCRHSFISNLIASGVDIHTVKELAGHSSIKMTEIYIHIAANQKLLAIQNLEPELTTFQKLQKRFRIRPQIEFSAEFGTVNFIVGRESEMLELIEKSQKKINILILGGQGVGKSHLIENLKIPNQNILRLDEMSSVKKTLQTMIIQILEEKQHLADVIFNDKGDDYGKIISKETIKYLTELLLEITQKHEYTIIIDDLDRIAPMGVKALEKLNGHFHIVGAARRIKIDKGSFTTNFEVIRIDVLKRADALKMIDKLSYDMTSKIENYEMYRNHIYEQTNGNPKFVYEMIERYDKEISVTSEVTRSVNHLAAIKEIDMSLPILIALSSLMILRYFGKETGETSYQFIGAIFMMFALFGRSFFNSFKRKFV